MCYCTFVIPHEMFAQMSKDEGIGLREGMGQHAVSLPFSHSLGWDDDGYKLSYPALKTEEDFVAFRKFDSYVTGYLNAIGFDEDGKRIRDGKGELIEALRAALEIEHKPGCASQFLKVPLDKFTAPTIRACNCGLDSGHTKARATLSKLGK